MKNIILLAFLLFPVLIQAQILPNQTSEKDPEGTDAIYTQENGTLNKILFDSAFYFFIPRIKTTALSYSITSTDNPDSLRGYFVLDNTATWYYIASDASSVSLGGGGGGGTTQLLSYSGTNLSISGGNTVSLANLLDNTDTQLTEAEVDAFVANNGYLTSYTETDPVWTADKPSYATIAYVDANDDTGTDDQTASEVSVTPAGNLESTNVQDALEEIQTQVDGLGGGGTADGVATSGTYNAGTENIDITVASPGSNFSIDVSALLDNTDSQLISLDGNTLNISGNVSAVDLSPYLDNTDTQAISLDGTTLSITGNASTVDLSVIQDGTGTDDQTASEVPVTPIGNLNSTDVQAALEEHQADIDAITGGGGVADGVITGAVYNAGTKQIDVTVAAPGSSFSFNVSALLDNTDAQDLSLDGTTLSLTGDATPVDLSIVQDGTGTDDQVIDVFSITGNTLSLSIEDDGEATKTVDLSGLTASPNFDYIQLNTAFDNQDFAVGEMGWDETGAFRFGVDDNYSFAVGQDMYKEVHNTTASLIPQGTALMMTGADGNSNVFTVAPMNYPTIGSEYLIGIAANDILAGGYGVAVQNGYVKGIDVDAAGWSAGDVLYLSETSAGQLTTTVGDVLVAAVTKATSNGSIYVRPDFYATNELQSLTWDAGTAGNDEITLSDGGGTITITDDVDDADANPANEYNTSVSWTDATNTVSVTDGGATLSAVITGFQETLTGSESVFDGWDKDATDDLLDTDFATAGLMASDGAGTYSIVTDNSANWNTAYGWGDHSTAGYLTTEVDGSITNEIQDLSLSGNTLTLSGDATTVDLSAYLDANVVNVVAPKMPYWDGSEWQSSRLIHNALNTGLNVEFRSPLTDNTFVRLSTSGAPFMNFGLRNNDESFLQHPVGGSFAIEDVANSAGNLETGTLKVSSVANGTSDRILIQNTTTNEVEYRDVSTVDAQTLGVSGDDITLTNGGSVSVINTVVSTTSLTLDLESARNRVVQIDMTSAGGTPTLSVSNPVSGGVYTFHFQNTTNHDINFPANFLKADGTTWDGGSTVNYSTADWLTCYFDGTNFHCK